VSEKKGLPQLRQQIKEALGFVYDDYTVSPFCTYTNLQKVFKVLDGLAVELQKGENFGEEMETLYNKFKKILAKKSRPRLNDAEGFNGFVLGYRLAREEILACLK
jgi:hypothetical protein